MKKLIIIVGIIGLLIALTFAARWWLPRLLGFAGPNSNVIQSITGLVQLAIWLIAGLAALFSFLSSRKTPSPPIEPDQLAPKSIQAVGPGSVALKNAIDSTIITGSGNLVIEQAHFTVEETQPEDITYLHQLPPVAEPFIDRVEEVSELEGKLEEGCRIYGFFGMGGIGKSDLATTFVEQHLSEHYPDAQFYVDLKGTSYTPKTVSQAQRHIIGSCRMLAKTFETDDVELSARYNNALYGKRAVVFLDNASNKEHVAPLTPHAKCAMVITSRENIFLSGMHSMTLPPLTLEDARALLLKLVPRIGDQADKIASVCGGLPQALRLAAGTLAEHPDLTVEEYVKRLADRKNRLELIEASIDITYRLLRKEKQLRFSQLAVFSESFDAGGAAAIWGLSTEKAKLDLEEFFKLSLLEWHGKARRYRLQTLVRDFADAQLAEPDRSTVQAMHAMHYLRVLNEAGQRYSQGQTASREGLNLFDIERTNIQTAQAWIQSNTDIASVALMASSNYSYGGSQLLALKELPSDRIKWHQAILTATRKPAGDHDQHLNMQIAEAGNLTFLGAAHRDLGDYDQTIKLCEEAAQIAHAIGNPREESNALGYSGIAYYYKGNYQEASKRIREAIEVANKAETKDVRGDVERLRYLGHAYRALGRYDEGLKAYQSSLQLARQFGDLSGENTVLSGLGRWACDMGNHDLARTEYFPQALRLAVEIGDQRDQCYALGHLGLAHRELGLYAEAKEYYQQGLKLAVAIGHRQLETYCRGGLAKSDFALSDFSSALSNAQIAVKLADQIEMKRAQQFWRTLLAQIYLYNEQLDDALSAVTEALSYKSEWVDYRSLTLHGLVLAKLNRQALAAESFGNAILEAQNILSTTPTYYDARYSHGIAACGLALTNPDESSVLLAQSIAALEQAYDNCKSAGVVNEALGLLKKLGELSSIGELDKPCVALEQLASRN